MRILFIYFLMYSVGFTCAAQSFIPGYIINYEGDSILVDLKDRLPLPCFQGAIAKENGKTRTYTSNDVQAYGYIGSKRFEVFEIDNEKIFLQVLVRGDLSFYQGLKFYYIKETELIRLYNFQPDESEYYTSFKTILNSFFLACAPLTSDHIKYTEKEITKLVLAYNKCKTAGDSGIEFKKQYPEKAFHFTGKIGVASSQMSLYDNPSWELGSPNQNKSYSFGIGMDFSSPKNINRLYLALEIFIEKNSLEFNSSYRDIKMDAIYLKIPIGVRYHIFLRDNTPYLGLGYLPYLAVDSQQSITDQIRQNPSRLMVTSIDNAHWSQHGIWAYAGYQQVINSKLKMNFEIRYEESVGKIGGSVDTRTYISALSFFIGVRY